MASPESRGLSQRKQETIRQYAVRWCRSIVSGWLFWWVQVGAGGWCQWACIPVIRALHLVAAGYLQECERRTRSARLKALVLGNASRASSAVLSFVAYYVDCRPVAQLRPLLKPPPLHFIHASSSSSEAETARRRLCCPSFISHSLCFSQPAEKKADREFSRSLSPEWKTEKHS